MKKNTIFAKLFAFMAVMLFPFSMTAQTPFATVNLWYNTTPPTSNGLSGSEVNHGNYISNVVTPTLTVYVPEKCNGKAVIACPGGAYTAVWVGTEGHNFAKKFLDQGVTYAVLKYRMPNGHPTVPAEDLQRAITIMRQRANDWGGYTTLGVMGSSAGGHLAATAATHFTDEDIRPDFQILCYPVTSFQDNLAHMGTRNALLGSNQTKALIDYYSNELQVTAQTPRAFIMHAADDNLVTPCASTAYADALMKNGVYTSLHIYPTGNHGCSTTDNWEFTEEYWGELFRFIADVPLRPKVIDDDNKEPFITDPDDGKIYALNNLGKYEPYGIYEKTRTLTVAEPRPARIEYIETTADMYDQTKAAYINTGYTHTPNTRVVMECTITSNRNFSALFGARKSYATNEFAFFSHFVYSGWIRENGAFGSSDGEINMNKVVPTGEKIRIEADARTRQLSIYKDGETEAYDVKTASKRITSGTCPLYIFNLNSNGTLDTSPAYMRLYSFKIYEADKLVHDYVPVVTADGQGALKDLVTNQILKSANDVPFKVSPDAGLTVYEGKMFLNETDHHLYRYTNGEFVDKGSYLKPVATIGTDYADLSKWSYDSNYSSIYNKVSADGSNTINPYSGQTGWEPLWYKLEGLTEGTRYNVSFQYSCSQWWSWLNHSFMPFSVLSNESFSHSRVLWPEGGDDGVLAFAALQEGMTQDQPISVDFTAPQDYAMLVLQFGYVQDSTPFTFQFANINVAEYDIPLAYEEPTAISTINGNDNANGTSQSSSRISRSSSVYDLQGRKIADNASTLLSHPSSKKGINIVDGKKILVR